MSQTSDDCLRQPDSNGVNRWSLPIEGDGGLNPPPRTVKERSSLTGFACAALQRYFIINFLFYVIIILYMRNTLISDYC